MMKGIWKYKYYLLSFLMILFLIYVVYFFTLKKNDNNSTLSDIKFIGHAFYGIEMNDYTNSVEALKVGYESGIRVMEVDFLFTSDGDLVLNHFWENATWEVASEFLSKKIKDKYTTMNLEDLLEYISYYKDLYIIIDTKEDEYDNGKDIIDVYKEIVNKTKLYDEGLLDRFIPQIYNFDAYKKINKLYKFKNNIFSIYKCSNYGIHFIQSVVYYCLLYDIDTIVIPYEYIQYGIVNNEKIDFIKSKNINIFINTINDMDIYNQLINMGITGVYTDYLKS